MKSNYEMIVAAANQHLKSVEGKDSWTAEDERAYQAEARRIEEANEASSQPGLELPRG